MSEPVRLEAGDQIMAEACPDQSARTWDLLRTVFDEAFRASMEDCTQSDLCDLIGSV